jgi:hypothetical protein
MHASNRVASPAYFEAFSGAKNVSTYFTSRCAVPGVLKAVGMHIADGHRSKRIIATQAYFSIRADDHLFRRAGASDIQRPLSSGSRVWSLPASCCHYFIDVPDLYERLPVVFRI